jgi:hypothetical protein
MTVWNFLSFIATDTTWRLPAYLHSTARTRPVALLLCVSGCARRSQV